ncbi:hypothetical protein ACTID9_18330 [Brevibacillus fluminis]|uniref:hypothetical protein n=1 Tax=Brevibacillus fluminis TaxID=511487 RepID=UPI003F8B0F48
MEQAAQRYHCCATCQHFEVIKEAGIKTTYRCQRLGYQTQPSYQFNCWSPKASVAAKIERERQASEADGPERT